MLRTPLLVVTAALAVASPAVGSAATADGPTAARAASQAHLVDDAGDIWVWSTGTKTWELWGTKEDADVLDATITHGDDAVEVVLTFDNLRKKRATRYVMRVKTAKMVRTAFIYASEPGGWRGKHALTKQGKVVKSPGFTHEIDYTADTVMFSIPRDLFDDPAWVKVLLRNDMKGAHRWTDNPHNTGAESVFTDKLSAP
jgi:hypothetical protein